MLVEIAMRADIATFRNMLQALPFLANIFKESEALRPELQQRLQNLKDERKQGARFTNDVNYFLERNKIFNFADFSFYILNLI